MKISIRLNGGIYPVDTDHLDEVKEVSAVLANQYYEPASPADKEEAAAGFLTLLNSYVHWFLRRYYPTYSYYYEDMADVAKMGILVGLQSKRYNPAVAAPTTYFKPYMTHELFDYISIYVRHSTRYFEKVQNKISRLQNEYLAQGMTADKETIMETLGISEKTYRTCENLAVRCSVSCQFIEGDGTQEEKDIREQYKLITQMSIDGKEELERATERIESAMMVRKALEKSGLTEKERKVVGLIYGLDSTEPGARMSEKVCAEYLGEDIRDIRSWHRYAKIKMRRCLEGNMAS